MFIEIFVILYKKKVYELMSAKVLVRQRSIKERFKAQLVGALRNLLIAKFR